MKFNQLHAELSKIVDIIRNKTVHEKLREILLDASKTYSSGVTNLNHDSDLSELNYWKNIFQDVIGWMDLSNTQSEALNSFFANPTSLQGLSKRLDIKDLRGFFLEKVSIVLKNFKAEQKFLEDQYIPWIEWYEEILKYWSYEEGKGTNNYGITFPENKEYLENSVNAEAITYIFDKITVLRKTLRRSDGINDEFFDKIDQLHHEALKEKEMQEIFNERMAQYILSNLKNNLENYLKGGLFKWHISSERQKLATNLKKTVENLLENHESGVVKCKHLYEHLTNAIQTIKKDDSKHRYLSQTGSRLKKALTTQLTELNQLTTTEAINTLAAPREEHEYKKHFNKTAKQLNKFDGFFRSSIRRKQAEQLKAIIDKPLKDLPARPLIPELRSQFYINAEKKILEKILEIDCQMLTSDRHCWFSSFSSRGSDLHNIMKEALQDLSYRAEHNPRLKEAIQPMIEAHKISIASLNQIHKKDLGNVPSRPAML